MRRASAERVVTVLSAAHCSRHTGSQSGGAFFAEDSDASGLLPPGWDSLYVVDSPGALVSGFAARWLA